MSDKHYSIDETTDEFGVARFFVADNETGDWVSAPLDTYEQAAEEKAELEKLDGLTQTEIDRLAEDTGVQL